MYKSLVSPTKMSPARDLQKFVTPVSHPSFSIFTIYSGDLEFFRVEKSYLSRPIHHMVNFLIPAESHNAGQKSHVPVKIWWVILGELQEYHKVALKGNYVAWSYDNCDITSLGFCQFC